MKDIPVMPGNEPAWDGRSLHDCIDQLMKEIDLAGRHGAPSTGDGRSSKGEKPKRTQITQMTSNGVNLTKETGKLWGIFGGKKKKK
jgi:hypothetical protein